MKDQTGKRIRKELTFFGSGFLVAYVLHVIGIIQNHTPARELITKFHVVLLVALVIYGAVVLLRILYYLVPRFWGRK